VLRFAFFRLALADFNFRFARLVSMYEASVSAAIDMILFGEVVLVNESPPHARNADKNALWISFFSFALCQWPIPNSAFSGCPECARLIHSKERTDCCNKKPRTLSGAGIYDVILTSGEFYSLHCSRLKSQ